MPTRKLTETITMLKFHKYLAISAAISVAALASCSVLEDDQHYVDENLDGIVFRFDCGDSFDVKAPIDKPGEAALNENLLSSVEVFMYPDGGTGSDAVVHAYFTNVQTTANYNVSITDGIVAMLCPNNAEKFRIYAIANYPRIVAAVEGDDPEDLSNTSVPTLEAKLQSIEMTGSNVSTPQSKFLMATDGALLSERVNPRNTTVVTNTVRLKRVAAKVSILVRVADEYEFDNTIIISGDTTVRHERWNPDLNGMKIYLVNGSKTGQVSGLPIENQVPFQYQELQFKHGNSDGEVYPYTSYAPRLDNQGNKVYDANGDLIFDATTESGIFYPSTYPFYSYPKQWNYGADDEPYLKLVIPWVRQRDDNQGISQLQKQYYYRVYCPGTPNPSGSEGAYDAEFIRNNWYKILLNVGILGSETDGGEVTLSGSYYIVDWQEREKGTTQQGQTEPTGVNDSDKEAEIKGARYLFVNDQFFELFNIEDLSIPYITSDDCEIADVYAKKYKFNSSQKDSTDTRNPAEWDIDIHLETTLTGGHIVLNHPLNNDTNGTEYDVSPYYITFTLRQRSNHNYAKTITVYQYPAIMIDLERNDGSASNDHGHTYVNNGQRLSWVGNTSGTSSGTNTNFNMVIIETTVLPPDSKYMLGDPRTSYVDNIYYHNRGNNLNNNSTYNSGNNYETWPNVTDAQRANTNNKWSYSSTSVQGNNRQLSWYYPVDRTSAANNIIAPRFRVASSHGATNALNYQNAFRRCASYQEAGYPAGRWRLPTVAEVTYAMKLNADGKIERLFGSSGTNNNGKYSLYWCNSGYISVRDGEDAQSKQPPTAYPGETTSSENVYVRCVYDDWYWDGMTITVNGTTKDVSKVDVGTFTWGDVQR